MIWNYSSYKDKKLTSDDFWQIFCPLTQKFIDDILKMRKNKTPIASYHHAHHIITDLICKIVV